MSPRSVGVEREESTGIGTTTADVAATAVVGVDGAVADGMSVSVADMSAGISVGVGAGTVADDMARQDMLHLKGLPLQLFLSGKWDGEQTVRISYTYIYHHCYWH